MVEVSVNKIMSQNVNMIFLRFQPNCRVRYGTPEAGDRIESQRHNTNLLAQSTVCGTDKKMGLELVARSKVEGWKWQSKSAGLGKYIDSQNYNCDLLSVRGNSSQGLVEFHDQIVPMLCMHMRV